MVTLMRRRQVESERERGREEREGEREGREGERGERRRKERQRGRELKLHGAISPRTHGTAYRLSCYVLFWVSILLPPFRSPLHPPPSPSSPLHPSFSRKLVCFGINTSRPKDPVKPGETPRGRRPLAAWNSKSEQHFKFNESERRRRQHDT